jgi:hypothetical protein
MSSDSTTAIAIVAVITGIGSAVALILKNIKHSECCKCCVVDTRTPINLAPPPSPIIPHKNNENKTEDNIKEIDV